MLGVFLWLLWRFVMHRGTALNDAQSIVGCPLPLAPGSTPANNDQVRMPEGSGSISNLLTLLTLWCRTVLTCFRSTHVL